MTDHLHRSPRPGPEGLGRDLPLSFGVNLVHNGSGVNTAMIEAGHSIGSPHRLWLRRCGVASAGVLLMLTALALPGLGATPASAQSGFKNIGDERVVGKNRTSEECRLRLVLRRGRS